MTAVARPPAPRGIGLRGLAVTYATSRGPLPALGPIDLDIAPGEFVALVGPSGCGKTTLLKVLAGLFEPTAGTVTTSNGVRLGRGDTGIVFQQPTLLPWRTVLDNVTTPARILGRDPAESGRRALGLLELVGLQAFANHFPHELSGGMQQRVGIARGLMSNPELLLMDEPFSALDALTREQMMVEMQGLWDEAGGSGGKSVLMVTHSIPEAAFMADRIVVFSERPARIIHIEEVRLPRPRGIETMADPALVAICDRLRRLLVARKQANG